MLLVVSFILLSRAVDTDIPLMYVENLAFDSISANEDAPIVSKLWILIRSILPSESTQQYQLYPAFISYPIIPWGFPSTDTAAFTDTELSEPAVVNILMASMNDGWCFCSRSKKSRTS